jgi:hypothetical protein
VDGALGGDESRLAALSVADLRAGEAGGALWASAMVNDCPIAARSMASRWSADSQQITIDDQVVGGRGLERRAACLLTFVDCRGRKFNELLDSSQWPRTARRHPQELCEEIRR